MALDQDWLHVRENYLKCLWREEAESMFKPTPSTVSSPEGQKDIMKIRVLQTRGTTTELESVNLNSNLYSKWENCTDLKI